MSLDDRLRDAFDLDDGWVPRGSLAEVRSAAQRQARRRWSVGAAAAAVVLAIGVGVALSGDGTDRPPAPAPPVETGDPRTVIDGRWTSEPLTRDRVRATLTRAGLGPWVDEVLAEVPASGDLTLALEADGGSLDLQLVRTGQPAVLTDREDYRVDGDQLVLFPLGTTGSSRYTWDLDGDRLTLSFVSTGEPPSDGVPAEAYQRVLYTAVPFTRD